VPYYRCLTWHCWLTDLVCSASIIYFVRFSTGIEPSPDASAGRVPSVGAGPFLSASSMRLSGDETDSEGSEPGSPNEKFERLNLMLGILEGKEEEYEQKLAYNQGCLDQLAAEDAGQVGKRAPRKKEEAYRKKVRKYQAKKAKIQERIKDAKLDRSNCRIVGDDRRPSRDHQLDVSHLRDAGRNIIAGVSSLTHRNPRRKKAGSHSRDPSTSGMDVGCTPKQAEPLTLNNSNSKTPRRISPPVFEPHQAEAAVSTNPTPLQTSPSPTTQVSPRVSVGTLQVPSAPELLTSVRTQCEGEFSGLSQFEKLSNLAERVPLPFPSRSHLLIAPK